MVFAHERRLPNLQRVVTLGRGVVFETHHPSVVVKRRPGNNQRRVDGLANQVVAKVHVATGAAVVKDVQKIFAVGRRHRSRIPHIGFAVVEPFEFARLQIITAGKNDPLVTGQQHARRGHFVQPHRGVGFAIENQIPRHVFAIRFHFQQD